jgi:glutathione S-transferase
MAAGAVLRHARFVTFRFVSVEEAIAHPGLRMVVVGGLPSPWSEAAKGIFAVKEIDWVATRLAYDDPTLRDWLGGHLSAPAVFLDDAPPRTGWAEILLMAERLEPSPALLPSDPLQRAWVMGLSHEVVGEGGLCWSRRLQGVHAGLTGQGGFSAKVSGYLAKKYGYDPARVDAVHDRVHALLGMFADRLSEGPYLMGEVFTAADIYLAAAMALFAPLPPEHCQMLPGFREAYAHSDTKTRDALAPVLLRHRDRVYERHLGLPLSL